MSRNQNSIFSTLPTVNIKRTRMSRPQNILFTGNTGSLIPFYWDEILPGDTTEFKTTALIRLQTPITPFMDQLVADVYYFFVPNRLVWNHWKEFMGENSTGPWVPNVTYTVPQLEIQQSSLSSYVSSALDTLGVPPVAGLKVNALPLRAYAEIWNNWFRDENLQYPLNIPKGDSDTSTGNNLNSPAYPSSGSTQAGFNGRLLPVNKLHDYFTSALPGPIKANQEVTVNIIQSAVPVQANGLFKLSGGSGSSAFTANLGTPLGISDPNNVQLVNVSPSGIGTGNSFLTYEDGLEVDLSGVSVATVSQLRTAFQIQKLLEADARAGSRYTEVIRQHFGIISPDARLQRPEYLGGCRFPLNVHQVVQSSETSSTPQGTTAAYSLTVDSRGNFVKSFTEHGILMGLICVRYKHSYQQGVERGWLRKTRFDYYWPVLAHLSEQEIKNVEIYAQGPSAVDSQGNPYDDQVFGYQERWSEYRYKPDRIAAEFRSSASNSLDFWHLGDDYASMPALSTAWIAEKKDTVDRILQVTSSVSNQIMFDINVDNITTRPMPMHSVPGLVDHF